MVETLLAVLGSKQLQLFLLLLDLLQLLLLKSLVVLVRVDSVLFA